MKLTSSTDGRKAVDEHNRNARHKPIKDRRTSLPIISDPALPSQEVRDSLPAPVEAQLKDMTRIEQWRRYDRRLYGQLIFRDGLTSNQTEQVPGLLVKLVPKDGYVIMDDGQYYALGDRAYAGT